MLESMRQKGASIFIYLIFGLLILIFVINFAPNAGQGGAGGCSGGGNTAITVDGRKVNNNGYKIAYEARQGKSRERVYFALDALIRREILAQAADARGLRVDRDAITEEIKKGWFFYAGERELLPVFDTHSDGSRTWNYGRFRGMVGQMNVSMNAYHDDQARGFQAALMAEVLASSVRVSRDEALQEYLFENNTVTYDMVSISPDSYRDAMRLSEADVTRFLTTHEEEVKAKYKAEEVTYKGTKPQVKLRQIFIAKAEPAAAKEEPAPDPTKKDDKGKPDTAKPDPAKKVEKDDKAPAAGGPKVVGMPIDEAATKLEATRAAIESGKQKFADAVKALSTDESQKARDGLVGWHKVDAPELAESAVNDAVKALAFKPGAMTPVIKGENGVYLLVAEEKREGDLTFDQVKLEIAGELAKQVWAKEAAKRAALDAHAQLTAGKGKNLDELFKRAAPPMPPVAPTQQMTPEMMEAIRKMQESGQLPQHEGVDPDDPNLKKPVTPPAGSGAPAGSGSAAPGSAAGSAEKTGFFLFQPAPQGIEIPLVGIRDVLAGSKAQADGSSGGSATTTPSAGSVTPTTPAAGSAKPTTPAGSAKPTTPAAGSATPAAGSGSATGSGSAAPTTPAAGGPAAPGTTAPAAIVATKDVLPTFGEVEQPKVETEGPYPRYPSLPGVGKDGVAMLFDTLNAGQLAPRVFEDTNGSYVLVQMAAKAQAKVEDFDKVADAEIAKLRSARGRALVNAFVRERCEALVKAKKIEPAAEKIAESDDKGNRLPVAYRPCASLP